MAKVQENIVNRVRVPVTFGADASVVAYTQFNTMMNAGNADLKWMILGAQVRPDHDAAVVAATANEACHFQIVQGAEEDFLGENDLQTIDTLRIDISSAGAAYAVHTVWPLPFAIQYPLPAYCAVMTCIMEANNAAAWNSKKFWFEIYYVRTPLSKDEMKEYVMAHGSI